MKTLEDRNFENLVYFFAPELRRVMKGRNAVKIFSVIHRKKLQQYEVLVQMNKIGLKGKRMVVTDKARKTLAEVK